MLSSSGRWSVQGLGHPQSQGWLWQGVAVRRVLPWFCLQGTTGDMPQLSGKWPTWVFLYGHRIARNSHLHRDGEFIFTRSCMSRLRRKRHFLIIINQLYLKRKRNQFRKWDAKEMRGKTISPYMDPPSEPWQHFLVSTCIKVTSPLQVARNTKSGDTGEAQEHPVRGRPSSEDLFINHPSPRPLQLQRGDLLSLWVTYYIPSAGHFVEWGGVFCIEAELSSTLFSIRNRESGKGGRKKGKGKESIFF